MSEPGQTTTRFQPHRSVGRNVKSRRTIRGPWQPASAIVYLLIVPVMYFQAIAKDSPWWAYIVILGFGIVAASLITRWVIDLLLWIKER